MEKTVKTVVSNLISELKFISGLQIHVEGLRLMCVSMFQPDRENWPCLAEGSFTVQFYVRGRLSQNIIYMEVQWNLSWKTTPLALKMWSLKTGGVW